MEAKRALRRRLLAARRALSLDDVAAAEEATLHLVSALPEVRRATRVAAYVSVGREPGTGRLRDELRERGVEVLLPVLRADDDLDWALDTGEVAAAGRGLLEPTGPRLGVEAITDVDLVLLPGLAVARDGLRLGRGGGSYDRALARLPRRERSELRRERGDSWRERDELRRERDELSQATTGAPLVLLLHRGEVLDVVPSEPHDRPVDLAVTPDGVHRFPRRDTNGA